MADTYELDPAVRIEEILNGDDIKPANRLEYFLKKAATEVPKPTSADAGKVVTVNEDGDGYVLGEGGGGGGVQIIRLLKIKDLPPVPDGWTPVDSYNMQNLESDAPVLFSPDVITNAVVENSNTNIMFKPSFIYLGGDVGIVPEYAPCVVSEQGAPYTPMDDSGQDDPCYITANVLQRSVSVLGQNVHYAAIDTSSLRWVRAVIQ